MLASFVLLALGGVVSGARMHGIITDAESFASNSYDFIIIGGGTSGLTVAARLTEDTSITVGVIEAGQYRPDDPLINVPFDFSQAVGNQTYDWSYSTIPQPRVNGRSITAPAGRVLGGSSALNFMSYDRASSAEYDAWKTLGNEGWDWQSLLPYFKKTETLIPGQPGIFPGTTGAPGTYPKYQGKNGTLQVGFNTNATFVTGLVAPYVNALYNAGSYPNANPDSGNGTGAYQSPRSVNPATGMRSYATSFVVPHLDRQNLAILTGAQVSKMILSKNGTNGTDVSASGVQFFSGSKNYTVKASKEVLVAGGALKSPQILELSGIGNSTLLQKYNIPAMVNLPGVGENFQDHLVIGSDYLLKPSAPITWDEFRNNATFAAEQLQEYETKHDGIYASTNAVLSFNPLHDFANSSEVSTLLQQLDSEISAATLTPLQKAQYSIQRDILNKGIVAQMELGMLPGGGRVPSPFAPLANRSYITVSNIGSRPFSRGSVHIDSADYTKPPVIDPNYLSFSFDQQVLTLGMRVVRRISQTAPLSTLVERPSSPPANVTSEDDYANWMKQYVQTVAHPCGTAVMAPQNIGGVVDANLKVYGTSNVRVIDASIIPLLFAAHTQTAVYAIAEKVADLIKSRH